MAVEIPVVVDIDAAFDEAAKRVNTAMRPLQRAIDANTMSIQLKFGEEYNAELGKVEAKYESLGRLINSVTENHKTKTVAMTYSVQEWGVALEDAKRRLSDLNALQARGYQVDPMKVSALKESITLLTVAIEQRQHEAAIIEQNTRKQIAATRAIEEGNYAMIQEANTISQINNKLSALRAKLENLNPSKSRKEWNATAGEIIKATKALEEYNYKLAKSTTKAGSINRMSVEMQALESQWNAMSKSMKFDKSGRLTASAQRVVDKFRELTLESEKFGRSLRDVAGKGASRLDTLGQKLSNILSYSLRLFALHASRRFLTNIREVTSQFELQRVALGAIIQDTERANSLFRQIKAAAIESPFQIKDLVTYTKQLAAYQIETEKLFDTTMKLADVSAGLGVDMNRLILAYGQVRAAAVLRGQELRQFTEAGIPLVEKLAEKFSQLRGETVKTGEVFKLISERAVPFSMIEEIFNDMTSAGGIFYKMQEKQAETLLGQWNNLKDAVSIMYDEIGNTSTVNSAMKDLIKLAKWAATNWETLWGVVKNLGTAFIAYRGSALAANLVTKVMTVSSTAAAAAESVRAGQVRALTTYIIGKTAAEKVSTLSTKAYTWAANGAAAANNILSASLYKLTMALSKNIFGVIAIALGLVVSKLISVVKGSDEAKVSIDKVRSSIEKFNDTRKETARLIDEYEALSSKVKLTATESKKLESISKELAKQFPKATEGLKAQGEELTLNVSKLREYNSELGATYRQLLVTNKAAAMKEMNQNYLLKRDYTRTLARGYGFVEGTYYYRLSKDAAAANKVASEIERLTARDKELASTIEDIDFALNGITTSSNQADKKLTEWQKKLNSFTKTYDGAQIRVLDEQQVENFNSLNDALESVAKSYKEYTSQVKLNENALQGKTGEEAKEISGTLNRLRSRQTLAKEILDYYNAFYLTEKKTGGDKRLSNLRKDIQDITNAYKKFLELRKYKNEDEALADIGVLFPQLQGWKPTYANVVSRLTGMLDSVKANIAKNPKDFVLIDMKRALEAELSNLNFDELKRSLSERIRNLSEEVKNSKAARDFFYNILEATGDQDIARNVTFSVYGGFGDDLEQKLKDQLTEAFVVDDTKIEAAGKNVEEIHKNITEAIAKDDFTTLKNLSKYLLDANKDSATALLDERIGANRDWLKDFYKTYSKADEFSRRINTLENQRLEKLNQAREKGMSQEGIDAINSYYNKEIAAVELERVKNTYEWTKAFEDLEGVSTRTLQKLISTLENWERLSGPDASPEARKAVARAKEQAEAQILQRDAYKAVIVSIKNYAAAHKEANETLKDAGDESEAYLAAIDAEAKAIKQLKDAMGEIESEMNDLASSAKNLITVFAANEDAAYFSEQMDNISNTLSATGKAGTGIARLIMGDVSPQAIVQTLTGMADIVSSIFSAIKAARLRDINKQIEEQERLLSNLSYTYDRLQAAEEKVFGAEYVNNYKQRLAVLEAQRDAYKEQQRLEESKGKAADKNAIQQYKDAARDAADAIAEMNSEIANRMTGTDLESAARDFASSWLDAYKSFASTTGAIKDKFADMIDNMVIESMAAKLVKDQLEPIFGLINDLSVDNDGFTVSDAAVVAQRAKETVGTLNVGLNNLMNALSGAGLNVRSMGSNLSGISKDIQGASEESILGLAAGVNTQNYYMAQINANVQAITDKLGARSPISSDVASSGFAFDTALAMEYWSKLPNIDANLAELLRKMNSVISPNNAKTNTHYVAIN